MKSTLIIKTLIISVLFFVMSSWQTDKLSQSIVVGKEVYKEYCMLCHKVDGIGSKLIPPLAKSDFLAKKREASIHAVKYGLKGPITVNTTSFNSLMAAQNLSDEEISDVMNYINHSWGNDFGKIVTVKEVQNVEK